MDDIFLFSILNHIFIFAVLNGLILIAFLIRSAKNNKANYVLAFWLGCLIVELGWNSLKVSDFFYQNPNLIGAMLELDPLYGPLFLLYILMQVEHYKPRWLHSLLLVPFMVTVWRNIQDFFIAPDIKLRQFERYMGGEFERSIGFYELFYFITPLMSYLFAFWVIRNALPVNDRLSSVRVLWLYRFSLLQVVAWLSVVLVCLWAIYLSPHVLTPVMIMASYLPYAIVLYFLSGYSLWQVRVGERAPVVQASSIHDQKYQKQKLSEELACALKIKLVAYMKDARPYLDNELTLAGLSEQLNMSSHHLSQLLNQHFNQSFYDFINEHRIKEIKRRLADPADNHKTILSLALSSGFNSKATFNSTFKRKENMTPSAYRRQFS